MIGIQFNQITCSHRAYILMKEDNNTFENQFKCIIDWKVRNIMDSRKGKVE